MTARYRSLDVSQIGDLTFVRLIDRKIVDDLTIHELSQELSQLVEETRPGKLVLNFAGVRYLSSGMMGNLIALDRQVKSQGGKLTLSDIQPEVFEAFALARLDRLFEILNGSGQTVPHGARAKPPGRNGV